MRRFLLLLSLALLAASLAVVAPAAAWTWPAGGPVLLAFSFDPAHPYSAGEHRGIDIGGDPGSAVLAPAAGVVTFAGTVPGNGKSLTILTSDGWSVTLTQLGSVAVIKGASIAEGDAVATIGPSGDAEVSGPYVQLGIRHADQDQGYVDPQTLLPPRSQTPGGSAVSGGAVQPPVARVRPGEHHADRWSLRHRSGGRCAAERTGATSAERPGGAAAARRRARTRRRAGAHRHPAGCGADRRCQRTYRRRHARGRAELPRSVPRRTLRPWRSPRGSPCRRPPTAPTATCRASETALPSRAAPTSPQVAPVAAVPAAQASVVVAEQRVAPAGAVARAPRPPVVVRRLIAVDGALAGISDSRTARPSAARVRSSRPPAVASRTSCSAPRRPGRAASSWTVDVAALACRSGAGARARVAAHVASRAGDSTSRSYDGPR